MITHEKVIQNTFIAFSFNLLALVWDMDILSYLVKNYWSSHSLNPLDFSELITKSALCFGTKSIFNLLLK